MRRNQGLLVMGPSTLGRDRSRVERGASSLLQYREMPLGPRISESDQIPGPLSIVPTTRICSPPMCARTERPDTSQNSHDL